MTKANAPLGHYAIMTDRGWRSLLPEMQPVPPIDNSWWTSGLTMLKDNGTNQQLLKRFDVICKEK